MYMDLLPTYVSMHHDMQSPEENIGCPETGVTDDVEPAC